MTSSLAQLVKMGLLDSDFLVLDNNQVQAQAQGQTQASSHASAATAAEVEVEYVDRNPASVQDTVPDDLEYYKQVTYHWLYASPSYGWWHFTKDDNEQLENMYRSGQKQGTLYIDNNTFTIDFEKMLQQGARRPRHLLRTPTLGDIVLKGVAGSRIVKRDILENSVDHSHFGVPRTLQGSLDSNDVVTFV